MTVDVPQPDEHQLPADKWIGWLIIAVEYAIVISLIVVAGIVLVRTVIDFLTDWSLYPGSVIGAIDGILAVIILLDIVHTVFRHLRSSIFPVRPFLVIGVLAGVRDILSSSARLTLSANLSTSVFHDTIISLSIGVGVVVFLLLGLLILGSSGHTDEAD